MEIVTPHFLCEYTPQETDIAQTFLTALENAFDQICDTFHFKNSELGCPYRFYLCGNVEDYLQVTGKSREDYQPWMVGNSDSQKKQIAVLSPKATEDCTPEYLQSVAVHELVHMMFDTVTNTYENEEWIAEGIAILFSGQTDLQYVSEDNCPLISELCGDSFADNGGYDYAGIYVWYFIRQYGFGEFIKAYQNQINISEKIIPGFERNAIRAYRKETV